MIIAIENSRRFGILVLVQDDRRNMVVAHNGRIMHQSRVPSRARQVFISGRNALLNNN